MSSEKNQFYTSHPSPNNLLIHTHRAYIYTQHKFWRSPWKFRKQIKWHLSWLYSPISFFNHIFSLFQTHGSTNLSKYRALLWANLTIWGSMDISGSNLDNFDTNYEHLIGARIPAFTLSNHSHCSPEVEFIHQIKRPIFEKLYCKILNLGLCHASLIICTNEAKCLVLTNKYLICRKNGFLNFSVNL